MSEAPKVTLLAENCWLIKEIKYDPITNEVKGSEFFESHKMWNKSPAHATLFNSMDAAEQVCWWIQDSWKRWAPEGWQDGFTREYTVVSYYDEIVNGPYGKKIEVKK